MSCEEKRCLQLLGSLRRVRWTSTPQRLRNDSSSFPTHGKQILIQHLPQIHEYLPICVSPSWIHRQSSSQCRFLGPITALVNLISGKRAEESTFLSSSQGDSLTLEKVPHRELHHSIPLLTRTLEKEFLLHINSMLQKWLHCYFPKSCSLSLWMADSRASWGFFQYLLYYWSQESVHSIHLCFIEGPHAIHSWFYLASGRWHGGGGYVVSSCL